MVVVGKFLSLVMMIFNVGIEPRKFESKDMFGFVPNNRVKSSPFWSKTDDSSHVKSVGVIIPQGS